LAEPFCGPRYQLYLLQTQPMSRVQRRFT